MNEQLKKPSKRWKVWKNPTQPKGGPTYLGEVHPPEERWFVTAADLRELGFGPGDYTVLAPEQLPYNGLFARWQRVTIPTC